MESQVHLPYLKELIVFLVVAAVLVPSFQRFRVSPTLGFLIIGTLIGPFGLGLFVEQVSFLKHITITEVEGVKTFAELGIIFLLFTIGLELTTSRLWSMRKLIFGLGFAQFFTCSFVFFLITYALGFSANSSILIGACIALSSTALVLQLLIEKGRFSSRVGRSSFSVLLFQDLAVVPIILLIGILGAEHQNGLGLSLITALATAVAVISCIVVFGKIILQPLFKLVTVKHAPEFFMALTLLILILSATSTAMAGLSMALGAFLAGLLLAETEFRHQIEIDIEPFKGLLMGLFFMSIGMAIDLRVVWNDVYWLIGCVVGIYVIKSLIITGLCLLFQMPRQVAIPTGLILGQVGEFAFVVTAMMSQTNLINNGVAQFIVVVASLSMIITPFVSQWAMYLMDTIPEQTNAENSLNLVENTENLSDHVIIAGFGRVGQTIAKMLNAQQTPFIAIERYGPQVMKMKEQGYPVIFGNANRKDVLMAVNADQASALVLTLDDPAASANVVQLCKKEWPDLPIFVRAYDYEHEQHLLQLGATQVVGEITESSLQLASCVLHEIGAPLEALNVIKDEMREKELSDKEEAMDEEFKAAENVKSSQTAA